jgi:Peptidase family M28
MGLMGRASTQPASAPWFGIRLPPRVGEAPAVVVGPRAPRPVLLPADDPRVPEFDGATIRKDLEAIVAFSAESRKTREIGSGQLWGRVSGFPSSAKTITWAVEQFRRAGIANASLQPITQEAKSSLWLPLEWELRLLADPAFGPGSQDVVLESAMPLAPAPIAGGTLTAPIVFLGSANAATLDRVDVKGKIAAQLIIPQAHMVFERESAIGRAQELHKRGALAVLNVLRQPGNEIPRDFSNCGGPCFNVGGRDGFFLERVANAAARAGVGDKLRARLTLKAESRQGLQAQNGVAVISGRSSDEAIVVDAHADAWFEGAGDNGDGLAVMLALVRYFARPEHRPARTLVFVASAGHHTTGINGPRSFITANPALAQKTVLVVNVEHVAQRNFSPSREVGADGYREAIADSGEAPIVAGVTNNAPFLHALFDRGVERYGVNFVSDRSTMQSGETGGFSAIRAAKVTIMQAPPLYHTTGEVMDVISTPGLERMARFLAYFLKQVDQAPVTQLNP